MLLTKEKIREIAVGAAAVYEEPSGLRFAKLTDDQLAAWKEAAPWIYANAVGSTGCRLDFTTDSDSVTVTTAEYGKYEVKINGVLSGQYAFRQDEGCDRINTFTVPLPGGVNRVTLTLPSHGAGGIISSVELTDGASCERHRFDGKMLFLGDSITQGWNTKYDSMSYAYLVSEYFNADSIIQGIGGAVFAPATVLPMDFAPDTVVIAYGTNDWGYHSEMAAYQKAAHDFMAAVKSLYGTAEIYVISPIWRSDRNRTTKIGTFDECCDTVKELCAEFGMHLIDGAGLVPPIMDYMADAVHPNDLGFAVYASNVIRAMTK